MQKNKNTQKCYNSLSCILSLLIIVFVVGAIAWDITVSKPAMRKSIDEIRIEVKNINEKIDEKARVDSLYIKRIQRPNILAEDENKE